MVLVRLTWCSLRAHCSSRCRCWARGLLITDNYMRLSSSCISEYQVWGTFKKPLSICVFSTYQMNRVENRVTKCNRFTLYAESEQSGITVRLTTTELSVKLWCEVFEQLSHTSVMTWMYDFHTRFHSTTRCRKERRWLRNARLLATVLRGSPSLGYFWPPARTAV